MRTIQYASIALVILSLATGLYFYPMLPERVVTHWGFSGEPNGYSDRAMGAFLVPVMSILLLGLFYVLPKIDPKRAAYAQFQKEYDGLVLMILGFLYYVFLLTLAFNFGYSFNLMQAMAPAFAVLFFYMGVLLAKAKQNWFVGIRTPWTLASEHVWNKTHKLGSKIFKAAGAVSLLGILMPELFIAAIAVMVGGAIALVVYSYVEFEKEKKRGKR